MARASALCWTVYIFDALNRAPWPGERQALEDLLFREILANTLVNSRSQPAEKLVAAANACWEFSWGKHQRLREATAHWEWLWHAALRVLYGTCAITMDPALEVIADVVRREEIIRALYDRDARVLVGLARRMLPSRNVASATKAIEQRHPQPTPGVWVLREFLRGPMKACFTGSGRLKPVKHCNQSDVMGELVEAFEDPERLVTTSWQVDRPGPEGLVVALSSHEACALTSAVMKAVFSRDTSQTLQREQHRGPGSRGV